MPLPLSPNSGLGMNVTVRPAARAVFLITYLYVISLSAIISSGRHREVAALVPGLVGEVAAVLVLAAVPGAFHRVNVVVALIRRGREPRRVEDVELRLRAEERGIPDPGATQVILGLTGDVARVPAVRRPGQRIMHEEREVQGLVRAEWVEHRS